MHLNSFWLIVGICGNLRNRNVYCCSASYLLVHWFHRFRLYSNFSCGNRCIFGWVYMDCGLWIVDCGLWQTHHHLPTQIHWIHSLARNGLPWNCHNHSSFVVHSTLYLRFERKRWCSHDIHHRSTNCDVLLGSGWRVHAQIRRCGRWRAVLFQY